MKELNRRYKEALVLNHSTAYFVANPVKTLYRASLLIEHPFSDSFCKVKSCL